MSIFSGSVSTVFLLTLSPHTPCGSNRLLMQVVKLQLLITQFSSVHRHQTVSPRYIVAFLPHLKSSHFGEQYFTPAKTKHNLSENKSIFLVFATLLLDRLGYGKCE